MKNLHVNFPCQRYYLSLIRCDGRNGTSNDTCSQDTVVIYVNARRGTGPQAGRFVQDLRCTPRWESSDLNLLDPRSSELLSSQEIIPDRMCTVMCLLLRANYRLRVQKCSLNGHSGLSSVPVLWYCRYIPYYTHYWDFVQQRKTVCRPVLWALTASMIFAYSNQIWASSRDILFSGGRV